MLGLGGELAKEVNFVFMSCYYYVQALFVMFSGLLGPLSMKAVILYSVLFQNLGPLLHPNFLWFCLTCGLKN